MRPQLNSGTLGGLLTTVLDPTSCIRFAMILAPGVFLTTAGCATPRRPPPLSSDPTTAEPKRRATSSEPEPAAKANASANQSIGASHDSCPAPQPQTPDEAQMWT